MQLPMMTYRRPVAVRLRRTFFGKYVVQVKEAIWEARARVPPPADQRPSPPIIPADALQHWRDASDDDVEYLKLRGWYRV